MPPAARPLMDELRSRTSDRHHTLDSGAFTRALANGTLASEAYWGMLKATAIIRDTLERTLEAHTSPVIASVWSPAFKRAPLLEQDLAYLEQTGVPDVPGAMQAASAVAEHGRLRAVDHPVSLLGWLYVMEGSMKGAPVLCRLARRTYGFPGDAGLAYLVSADDASATWSDFADRMNALTLGTDERERVVEAAIELFDGLIAVFQVLQPAPSSLNPEAGRHPLPSDSEELAAAERAGDTCWQMFPYLDKRYGDRGRRFTSSDSAWLVTLAGLDQETANQQVLWLGRVLGARGLPRLILECQLRLLHQELSAAMPAKTETYTRLLEASQLLHSRRAAMLTDEQVDAVAAQFEARVSALHDRLPHTGVLIVSAVTDAHDGVPSAVESLTAWLTNSGRFSAEWTRAVDQTINETRGLLPVIVPTT